MAGCKGRNTLQLKTLQIHTEPSQHPHTQTAHSIPFPSSRHPTFRRYLSEREKKFWQEICDEGNGN